MSCISATNVSNDDGGCPYVASKEILDANNVTYNSTDLKSEVCGVNNPCDASIAAIRAGLDKVGLTTHAYKNVNMSNLNENDIIYLTSEGGHYVNYHANKTNLTDFTGYVITPNSTPTWTHPHLKNKQIYMEPSVRPV